jgi:hypothetical protein
MKITQISVFLDNRAGVLAELTEYLGSNGVNIRALNVAESRDFGVIRMIVADPDRVAELLREKGYSTQKVDVIAVHVDDEPGGLGKALRALADQHLNVDYLYTFLDKSGDKAIVIMRVDNHEFATSILSRNGFDLLNQEDVIKL